MHTCAVKSDATAWCWGRNDQGQLGDTTTTDSLFPVPVSGPGGTGTLTDAAAGAAGDQHGGAIRPGGTVWCWGDNTEGKLGDGTTADSSSPRQVL